MDKLHQFLEVVGAVSTLLTALAALMPTGSPAGKRLARWAADLKGHLR